MDAPREVAQTEYRYYLGLIGSHIKHQKNSPTYVIYIATRLSQPDTYRCGIVKGSTYVEADHKIACSNKWIAKRVLKEFIDSSQAINNVFRAPEQLLGELLKGLHMAHLRHSYAFSAAVAAAQLSVFELLKNTRDPLGTQ